MGTKEKNKIIFLDFDGVITHYRTRYNVDPNKVKLLENILSATNAKIVVSSSWSVGCRNAEEFVERDLRGFFERKTKCIAEDSLFIKSIIDVTDHMGSCRGDEIDRWVYNHEDEIESYVIIDDDSDMLEEQLFNFVQTDGWYGLSDRTVDLAIQVLNNEKVISPLRLNQELMFKWKLKCKGLESNIEQLLMDYNNKFKE